MVAPTSMSAVTETISSNVLIATSVSLVLSEPSLRTPNCRCKSGLWLCTLSAATRRAYPPTNSQGILRLRRRQRGTFSNQYDTPTLEGEVEIDEMYLGGRETNKHESKKTEKTQGRSTKTKTPIFGMVARKGEARAIVVPNTQAATLMPIIKQFVADNAYIFTDELSSYAGLTNEGYKHGIIHHGKKEFYKDGITTNSIEGFWGHFKRMVFGNYHFVSKAYLQQYINEAVYRYNTRKADESVRLADMFAKSIGVCSYEMVKALKAA